MRPLRRYVMDHFDPEKEFIPKRLIHMANLPIWKKMEDKEKRRMVNGWKKIDGHWSVAIHVDRVECIRTLSNPVWHL